MKSGKCGWWMGATWLAMLVAANAEYHVVSLHELDTRDGGDAWAETLSRQVFPWNNHAQFAVRANAGAWLGAPPDLADDRAGMNLRDMRLALHAPDGGVIEGFVDLAMPSGEIRGFAFSLDTDGLAEAAPEAFEAIRRAHYARLARTPLPGAAWFRHLAGDPTADPQNLMPRGDLNSTFAMFSGSRAVAENLALDRELILGEELEDAPQFAVSEIQGITVRAIDWSGRIDEANPPVVDALALAIPADQHALFAPSVGSLLDFADWVGDEGAALMPSVSAENPYRSLARQYRAQLGLDVPDIVARRFEVRGVAVTGGDPYLPSGTDMAVVFDPENPDAFHQLLLSTIRLKAMARGAKMVRDEGEGWQVASFATADRAFSSHVARIGRFVVLANSPLQVKRLAAVASGGTRALGELDEFRFFRQRYAADADETAFLFISDDTIRRWCGPELRIGASRRARAMAALLELTASAQDGEAPGDTFEPLLGDLTTEDGRVTSETHGTLAFMTPVSELGVETATAREKDAYEQWRRGYENAWPVVFDPIAVRFAIGADRRAMDLTVLPLSAGSDYEKWIELAGDARLSPRARGVPDGAPLFLSLALDTKSELFRTFDMQMVDFLPELKVEPLGWMGESVTIWIDEVPDAAMTSGAMLGTNALAMLPLVARIESKSPVKLALFLTGVRASIEKSSPGLLTWENRHHGKQAYVVVREEGEAMTGLAVYYASMRGALLVSTDEVALIRAIERERVDLPGAMLPARHAFAEISPALLESAFNQTQNRGGASRMQSASWAALPVLNEWMRRLPGGDPVALHRGRFATDLQCPGGRGYRWNAEAMTMESAVFGHPATPRADDPPAMPLLKYPVMRAGLDFEDGGLRVRASMGPAESRLPVEITNDGELLGRADEFFLNDTERVLVYEYDDYEETQPDTWERVRKTCTERLLKQAEGGPIHVLESASGEEVWRQRYSLENGMRLMGETSDGHDIEYEGGTLELPAELRAGAIHQAFSTSRGRYEGEPHEAFHRTVLRIIGKERIEVPAGVFEDALRVEKTRHYLEPADGISHMSREINWYGAGIGLIKAEVLSDDETDSTILMEIKP